MKRFTMQDVRASMSAGGVTGADEQGRFTWARTDKDADAVRVCIADSARLGGCVRVGADEREALKAMRLREVTFPYDTMRKALHEYVDVMGEADLEEWCDMLATCASVTVKESDEDKKSDKKLDKAQPSRGFVGIPSLKEWYESEKQDARVRLRESRIVALVNTGMTREEAEAILPL